MEDVTTEDTETPSAARKAADEDCALRRKPPLILGTTKDGWNYFGWKVRRPLFGNRLPCRTKCGSVYSVVPAPTKIFEVPLMNQLYAGCVTSAGSAHPCARQFSVALRRFETDVATGPAARCPPVCQGSKQFAEHSAQHDAEQPDDNGNHLLASRFRNGADDRLVRKKRDEVISNRQQFLPLLKCRIP